MSVKTPWVVPYETADMLFDYSTETAHAVLIGVGFDHLTTPPTPAAPHAGNEAMREALKAALAEHDETRGHSINDAHWSAKARAALKDTAP